MYSVIDRQTGKVVGSYSSLNRARNRVIKLDLEYGACRYYYRSEIIDNPQLEADRILDKALAELDVKIEKLEKLKAERKFAQHCVGRFIQYAWEKLGIVETIHIRKQIHALKGI